MSVFRLSPPPKSLFSTIIWAFVILCVFVWLYAKSAPHGEIADELHAAGPDGVTAFFASPETAVTRCNQMLSDHDWTHLARYYDFTYSTVLSNQVTSGAYFNGTLAVAPEGAIERPFPPGYHYLYTEPTELSGIIRVVVSGAPGKARPTASAPEASFFMRAEPQGYRIIPADAAGRLNAMAKDPTFRVLQSH